MRYLRFLAGLCLSFGALLAGPAPALAQAPAQTLVVGVDHADPAHQGENLNGAFDYTDFFPRTGVTLHSGDTLDLRYPAGAEFHVIGMGPSDAAARATYPVYLVDSDDPIKAVGTDLPKIEFGAGVFSVIGGSTHGGGTVGKTPAPPPDCGLVQANQPPCIFKGGDDIESAGPMVGFNQQNQPAAADIAFKIMAPPGTYNYLCFVHPGMTGTVTVVDPATPTSTQAQLDVVAAAQFAADQAEGIAALQAANQVRFTGGAPGTRTYQVSVGTGTTDMHVSLLGMFPALLDLTPGDQVQYLLQAPNDPHTVTFPAGSKTLPEPIGFDCGTSFQNPPSGPPPSGSPSGPSPLCLEPGRTQPELVGDPGNAPPGTALTNPAAMIDSGLLAGSGYGLTPSTQQWSITSNGATVAGTYKYQCTIHDNMVGTLVFAANAAPAQIPAQTPGSTGPQLPAQMPNTGAGGATTLFWLGSVVLGLLLCGLGTLGLRARR
jgi:plastocyanin